MKNPSPSADAELRGQLLSETAKVEWKELEKHFARGVILVVEGSLDLIDVALAMSQDDKDQVSDWMTDSQLVIASMDNAKDWQQRDPILWAVVAAPWVLVQERTG
jgi:hypothetical protein